MTLFVVSAILVVDQLTASASIGVSAVGWWIVAIVVFFVPYGLIVAELGTTYPVQGGIHEWVERAFGARWAARTTYWYWVNVALWMPSVYLLFTGLSANLAGVHASVRAQALVAIALSWLTVLLGLAPLRMGVTVTGASALVKAAVILVIGVGGIVSAVRFGPANHFDLRAMLPDVGATSTFLPVLVHQLIGFELVSSFSGELTNPRRDVARGIFLGGLALAGLYLLGTVGILLVLPLHSIGLTGGLGATFTAIFGSSSPVPWILGIAVLATYIGNTVTWTLGANRSIAVAAKAGELPAAFGLENRRGAPVGASLLTGAGATVVLLVTAVFITDQNSLYYALFAASSVVLFLPYLTMFPAVIRLRRRDPSRPRPVAIPGGRVGVWVAVVMATGSVAASVVLFVWTPGRPVDWSYTGPLLGVSLLAVAVGELVVTLRLHRRDRDQGGAR